MLSVLNIAVGDKWKPVGCCNMLSLHWSVEDPAHSDFLLLRDMLVRTHMQDLKDVTQEIHYENYRAQCIQNMTRMVVQERKRRWVSVYDTVWWIELIYLLQSCWGANTDRVCFSAVCVRSEVWWQIFLCRWPPLIQRPITSILIVTERYVSQAASLIYTSVTQ